MRAFRQDNSDRIDISRLDIAQEFQRQVNIPGGHPGDTQALVFKRLLNLSHEAGQGLGNGHRNKGSGEIPHDRVPIKLAG